MVKSTPNPGLANGLVGYWNFDEGQGKVARDYSGKGNDGALTNMSQVVWTKGATSSAGTTGGALNFDGTDDYINVGSSALWQTIPSFTVCGWLRPSVVNSTQKTLATTEVTTSTGWSFNYNQNAAGAGDAGKVSAWVRAGGAWRSVATGAVLVANQWIHTCMLWQNGANLSVYINGVQSASSAFTQTINFGADNGLQIGRTPQSSSAYVNGSIDEVRIYNRALSAAEIMRLYNLKKPVMKTGDKTGLVGYWNFDEGAGTIARDTSGNRNNGTLTSMASPGTSASGWTNQGKRGGALNFDGTDDYVNIGDVSVLKPAAMTISAWVKPGSSSVSWQGIVTKKNDATTATGYTMAWGGDDNKFVVKTNSPTTDPRSSAKTRGQWYHVTMTASGSSLILYVNGVQEASVSDVSAITNNSSSLRIGRWDGSNATYGNQFTGSIDDVRIYNRALSASEVLGLYKAKYAKFNTTPAGNNLASGLVGYWNFDGKNTTVTYTVDLSGNNNTGTLTPPAGGGPQQTIGKIGQALKFDGVDDYIQLPASSMIGSGNSPMSISLWLYPTKNLPSNANYIMPIRLKQDNQFFWVIYNNGGSMVTWATFRGSSQLASPINYNSMKNRWNHMVVIYNGGSKSSASSYKIYLDGAALAEGTTNLGVAGGLCNDNAIGADADASCVSNNGFMKGSFDDVRIYNRVLSADEVKRLYNMGK